MGLQKYRADIAETQADGAIVWSARWLGGPTLAKVENCRMENLHGEPRVTAYVTSEPDTWFSIPAKAYLFGKVVNGYLTSDDSCNLVFRHCYY